MKKECIKVSLITIIVNIFLSGIKLVAGIFGKSSAMISDAIHSISDVLSTIVVIVGIKIADKKEDKLHPYGHERFESVASILFAFMLFITSILIGYTGIINIFEKDFIMPKFIALIASIISIVIKEWMYWYTIIVAKKYDSDSLKADAWHHRSDALSSIGSLFGIVGSMLGFIYMDVIAGIIISLIILKVSIEIFIDSIKKLIDCSCDDVLLEEIKNIVYEISGVINIETIKTRVFGNKIYIDLEIYADKNISFEESHNIAHMVHDRVEEKIVDVNHCMVHISPK